MSHPRSVSALARTPLAVLLAAACLSAQRTWTVGGAGADFADLPPAVAAAADGDTILVRAGQYNPTTTGKALTILGDPGARIGNPFNRTFTVTGLPAGRSFVMKGIRGEPTAAGGWLALRDNAGRVHLEGLTLEPNTGTAAGVESPALAIERSVAVSVLGCRLSAAPGLKCVASTAVVTDTSIRGLDAQTQPFVPTPFPAWPGVAASGSVLILAQVVARGGNGIDHVFAPQPARPAAQLDGDSVISGDASASFTGGTGYGAARAVQAAGNVLLDPSVVLVPPGVAGAAWVGVRRLPSLTANGAGPAGVLTSTLYAETSHLAVLLAGLPTDPVATPFGQLWIAPTLLLVLDVATIDATEHRRVTVPVPPDQSLTGVPLALQSLTGPVSALSLSTPAVVVLR